MPNESGPVLSLEETARLKYRCRRGLLELDTLLANFIESPRFSKLSVAQFRTFEKFLDESDPQLLSWLLKKEESSHKDYQELIQMICSSKG